MKQVDCFYKILVLRSLRELPVWSGLVFAKYSDVNYQHRIAIGTKPVLLLNCCFICIKEQIISGKRRYHHQKSGIWQMKITYHHIRYLKFIWRKDKFICPAIKWFKITVGRD